MAVYTAEVFKQQKATGVTSALHQGDKMVPLTALVLHVFDVFVYHLSVMYLSFFC